MTEFAMVGALAMLVVCQLIGEIVVHGLRLPVPGPVLGLLLLVAWFAWRGGPTQTMGTTADVILSNLSLLFVPAAVGIVQHGQRFMAQGPAIVLALFASSVLTIAVTAYAFLWADRRFGGKGPVPTDVAASHDPFDTDTEKGATTGTGGAP
ncbi:CidA/LrgA family protein [Nitrospirillum sp. BR 11163]|uniref:CidA/LrgA family protein n=1 Tax=Nitrospirillum sp. BR 11163 TaxID=3104323 RepID=UPI002AFEC0CD|nr:CidA/LrgA family protein [Nitrospirillum sp. BR 11163]MEA1676057.1 CidA/LrgA family protein [Nitrospirillum sp. BR 11163]